MMDFSYETEFDLLFNDLSNDSSDSNFSPLSSLRSSPIGFPILEKVNAHKKKKILKRVSSDDSTTDESVLIPKQRILRGDIRRSYFAMFLNVINTRDFPLMYGFFDTFFLPNMQSVFTRPDCHLPVDKRLTHKQSGIFDVARYWWSMFSMKPDAVLRLKSCNIITPPNSTESIIVSNFNFQATILYDEIPHDVTNPHERMPIGESNEVITSKRKLAQESLERTKTIRNIMSSVDNMLTKLSIRKEPLFIDADGVVTMHIDADKRITKLEMHCHPCKQ